MTPYSAGRRMGSGSFSRVTVGGQPRYLADSVCGRKTSGSCGVDETRNGTFPRHGVNSNWFLLLRVYSGGRNVYTATLDLDQGKVLTPPVVAIERGEGNNWAPAWSPTADFSLAKCVGGDGIRFSTSVMSRRMRCGNWHRISGTSTPTHSSGLLTGWHSLVPVRTRTGIGESCGSMFRPVL